MSLDLSAVEKALLPAVAPLAKQLVLEVVHPELLALEDKIGNEAVKAIVVSIEAALEAAIIAKLDALAAPQA